MEEAEKGTLGRGNGMNKDTRVSECLVGSNGVAQFSSSLCPSTSWPSCPRAGAHQDRTHVWFIRVPPGLVSPTSDCHSGARPQLVRSRGLNIHCQQSQNGDENEGSQTSVRP